MKNKKKRRRIVFKSIAGNESFPEVTQENTLKNAEDEKVFSGSGKNQKTPSVIMQYLTEWIGTVYSTLTGKIKPDHKETTHPVGSNFNVPDKPDAISSAPNAESRILEQAEAPSAQLYHRGSFSNPDSMDLKFVSGEIFRKMLETATESHKVLQDLYTAAKEIHRELTE